VDSRPQSSPVEKQQGFPPTLPRRALYPIRLFVALVIVDCRRSFLLLGNVGLHDQSPARLAGSLGHERHVDVSRTIDQNGTIYRDDFGRLS
jgi:hypothetical protein